MFVQLNNSTDICRTRKFDTMPISEVFCEDNMAGMARYPDGYFHLAIVDPPYGIGESRKQGPGARNDFIIDKRNGVKTAVKTFHKIADWDDQQPTQSYFDELFRVSRRRIIFGENYLLFSQKQTSTGRIFWDKVNGENDFSDGELIWTDCIKSVRQIEFMWNGMMQGKSLQEGRVQNGDKREQKRIHQNQKPVLLYKWLLTNYAKPGDRILDTHLGSGSHRIAAWDMGFDFWAWENDPDYFAGQQKRFEAHIAKQVLFAPEEMYQFEQAKLFD